MRHPGPVRRPARAGRSVDGARRARLVAALLAGLALVAASCSGSGGEGGPSDGPVTFEFSGVAATVDGTDIPAEALADQVEVFRSVPGLAERALGIADVVVEGTDQPTPELVADLLRTEIAAVLVDAELRQRQLQPTDADLAAADVQVTTAFGELADSAPADFVASLKLRYAQFITLDRALADLPTDDDLRAIYDASPEDFDEACTRHILVDTREDADAVAARLSAGEDFAELARSLSSDPGSAAEGGSLGCGARGQFVEPFEQVVWNAPVGEVQGPIETQFGFHLIEVTDRRGRTFEESLSQLRAEHTPQPFSALGSWVWTRMLRAEITVDGRFGTRDTATGEITPVGGGTDQLPLQPVEGPSENGAPSTAPGSGSGS